MSITLHQGSILDSTADTIVNPANCFLKHGGGLAAAIDRAAQDISRPRRPELGGGFSVAACRAAKLWAQESAEHPAVATGDATWTTPGVLGYKGIVHAVGPIWAGGRMYERQLLASAYSRSIAVARHHGCTSIAFPAISAGIFRFPIAEVAQIGVRQAAWHNFEVEFWLFSDEDYAAFEIALMEVPSI